MSDHVVGKPELWQMADALRGSMDAAEYKHVILGLIFLKYISDAFEEARVQLERDDLADPEDPDEYRAQNIFWVPTEASRSRPRRIAVPRNGAISKRKARAWMASSKKI